MRSESVPAALIEHLQRISSLDSAKARQLVEEVLSFYQEGVEQYTTRRHSEVHNGIVENADRTSQAILYGTSRRIEHGCT